MTTWDDADVKCPYYRASDKSKCEIICEACGSARVQAMRFADGPEFDRQILLRCTDLRGMELCEQYIAVSKKYE